MDAIAGSFGAVGGIRNVTVGQFAGLSELLNLPATDQLVQLNFPNGRYYVRRDDGVVESGFIRISPLLLVPKLTSSQPFGLTYNVCGLPGPMMSAWLLNDLAWPADAMLPSFVESELYWTASISALSPETLPGRPYVVVRMPASTATIKNQSSLFIDWYPTIGDSELALASVEWRGDVGGTNLDEWKLGQQVDNSVVVSGAGLDWSKVIAGTIPSKHGFSGTTGFLLQG